MRIVRRVVLLVLIGASSVSAWSSKEHIQLTRIAARRLINDPATPPAMKVWLQSLYPQPMDMAGEKDFFFTARVGADPKGVTGISREVIAPDAHAQKDPAGSKVPPFNVHERLLHYIDLELFISGDAKRVYKHDLSNKPKIENIPHDMKDERYLQAGMLPLRVEDCYQKLVKAIKENRLAETADNDNAVHWAGYLAHYLEDNTQPQHATLDYKSAAYFAGPKKKIPNVHAEVEYKMCDDEKNDFHALRAEFWPLFEKALENFKDPIETDDPFTATLQVSLKSYDALPLIGLAAMKATGSRGTPEAPQADFQPFDTEVFFRFQGNYDGQTMTVMQMKAQQTAWAVKRVERLWRKAWEEAGK